MCVIRTFKKSHYFCEYRLTGRLLVLASLIFSLREEAGARDVIAAGNFVDPTSMSDSSTADEAVRENLKVSKIQEAVIRIAGNSQDGIQSIGGFLARLAGRSEQEGMTHMTIPSTISGGPSIFQVRLSSGEVLTSTQPVKSLPLKRSTHCGISAALTKMPEAIRMDKRKTVFSDRVLLEFIAHQA